MIFLELFYTFFYVGCFSFGGGYAILSFLHLEVERLGWMSTERFVDFIAIAQSTPGPIALNMATFVGYENAGVPGAICATIAVSLPGMILITLFALFFFHFYERNGVQAVFRGLRPAVVGLIAAAAWQIGKIAMTNWTAVAVTLVCLILIAKWKISPVFLVVGSALAGILLF